MPRKSNITLEQRFWNKVRITDGCWEWTASLGSTGYGQIGIRNRPIGAHRVSYEIHYGPIPEGMCVLHHCDNRLCVRPDHLFLGTRADNIRDMDRKNRGVRNRIARTGQLGESNRQSVVTADQVRKIRSLYASGLTMAEIAKQFPIGESGVGFIVRRETWRHID